MPQFYLTGFADDRRRISQIEKASGKLVRTSVANVASIRDYHRLDHEGASDPNSVEKTLGKIEGLLASALRKAIQSGIDDPGTRELLTQLLSLLRWRVPVVKDAIELSLRQVVHAEAIIAERGGLLPAPPEALGALECALASGKVSIEISNWICLQHMFRLAFEPELIGILSRMCMTILRAPTGASFVTSDQPVALFHPAGGIGNPYRGALVDRQIEVSLPLTRDRLLLLTWGTESHLEREAAVAETQEFNRRVVINASSYVFAKESPNALVDLIHTNADRFAGFESPTTHELARGMLQTMRIVPVFPDAHY